LKSLPLLLAFAVCLPVFAQTPYQSITSEQRWHRYWEDTLLSPNIYLASVGSALVSQFENDPPEWRQGMAGFGRRTASQLGLHVIQETVHQGGSAMLGYDPRYRPCECKGLLRRSAHAIKWSFLTRNSSGDTRFDIPAMAGAYGGGMLSMSWYPHRFNPLTDGVRIGSQQVGLVVGMNVVREFMPDVKRKLKLKN
jgi:hypothetical protein